MTKQRKHNILNYFIASIWLINGLLCKVLNLVPRHEQIVAEILGNSFSRLLTVIIGILEIVMAIWVLSKFKPKLNSLVQIIVVATMNILEYILVPNLLLWGSWNIVFAFLFIALIFYNQFAFNKKILSTEC